MLSIFAITAVFAACNNNPKTGTDTATSVTATDTATANHNAFTDKAREVQLNGVSDTIVSSDGSTYVKVTPKDSEAAAPVSPAPVRKEKSIVRHTSTRSRRASSTGSGAETSRSERSTETSKSESSAGSNGTSGTSDSSGSEKTATTETKKKGWSKAAKGAVIGAGTGAAAGAIISKKKGKGAIIGGIIGATGGYIIGKGKDKKDGRQ